MYIFIVNPIAGNGRSKKIYERLTQTDTFKRISSDVYFTKYKGHVREIVSEISEMDQLPRAIIVIGGDGTMNDIANGMEHFDIPIGFIPGGSGNDFARGCHIKGKPEELFAKIVDHGTSLHYWFGTYKKDDREGRFANNLGLGLDAEVAKEANESTYKRFLSKFGLGNLSYLIALIRVVLTFRPKTIELIYDNEKRKLENCWVVTISNHPYLGGGMKFIPTAKIRKKYLSVLIVHSIPKWKVLTLFLTVFTGYHIRYKEVEVFETKKLHISSNETLIYHTDGETDAGKTFIINKENEHAHIVGTTKPT